MRYDYKKLYQKNAAFYTTHPKALRALLFTNTTLTWFFVFGFGAFLLYAYFAGYTLPDFLKMIGLPLFCLCLVGILRIAVKRPRPYSEKGASITPFLKKSSDENQSFPSRHVASAFVISMVLSAYLPWAGICSLVFSLVLSYVRFAIGVHYPSDLIGGACVGLISGIFVFIF